MTAPGSPVKRSKGQGRVSARAGAFLPLLIVVVGFLALACNGGDPLVDDDGVNGVAPPDDDEIPDVTVPPGATLNDVPRRTDVSQSLTGAGATFPNVLYSTWVDEYSRLNSGIRVNYQSIGSGGGIRAVVDRTVDFGGTDGPMTEDQKEDASARVWHIPTAMGAVVPAYNLEEAPDELRFSQDTIAGIFLGHIDRWDDPAIAADNPGADLPDQDIAVCHRSDGAGTTFIWVDFLAEISDEWAEDIGVATSVSWPRGNFVGGNGNEGVAQCIQQIDGALGYVEIAYAETNNLPVAQLENAAGNFVEPTLGAVTEAAGGMIEAGEFPDDMEARVANAPGEGSWPASGFTWLLVYEELAILDGMSLTRAQELIRFMLWALDEDGGQQYTEPLDYAPIHPDVRDLAHEAITGITYHGQPVWETMLEQ